MENDSEMLGVGVLGKKGGTGKTTLSHLLALGATWKGQEAHLMHTDDREPIKTIGRPYHAYDTREISDLQAICAKACERKGISVIDSGGNRANFDAWVAEYLDLIILPTAPDPEDTRMALQHFQELREISNIPIIFAINKYPSNPNEKAFIRRYLSILPIENIGLIVPSVAATRLLREDDVEKFRTPPPRVNAVARHVYGSVMNAINASKHGVEKAA